jgi:hypothetical protein
MQKNRERRRSCCQSPLSRSSDLWRSTVARRF